MNDTTNPKRPSRSLVGIIAVFTIAGLCAGFAGGQLTTRWQATKEVDNIRLAYSESQKVRNEALQMCLQLAPKAADSAASSAAAATKALEQSEGKPQDERY